MISPSVARALADQLRSLEETRVAIEIEMKRAGKTEAGRSVIAPKTKAFRDLSFAVSAETSARCRALSANHTINWSEYIRRAFRRAFVDDNGHDRDPPEITFVKRPRESQKGRLSFHVVLRIDLGAKMVCRSSAYWLEVARQAVEAQLEIFEGRIEDGRRSRQRAEARARAWDEVHPDRTAAEIRAGKQLLERQLRVVRHEYHRRTYVGTRTCPPGPEDEEIGFAVSGEWIYGPLTRVESDLWAAADVEFESWIEAEGLGLAYRRLGARR